MPVRLHQRVLRLDLLYGGRVKDFLLDVVATAVIIAAVVALFYLIHLAW